MKRTPLKRKTPLKAKVELKGKPSIWKVRDDPLFKLASEYVRRLSKGYCERCGQYKGWKNLDACHFIKRRKVSVKYDEDNLIAGCAGCHKHLDENEGEFQALMVRKISEDRVNMLKARANLLKPKIDRSALALYYREKLKLLRTEEI